MPTHCYDAGHGHRRAPLRQAIVDLDDRKVLAVLDTGVVPVSTQTQDFDEATVDARFGLRPALKPIRITQPQGKNFTIDGGFIVGRSGSSTSATSGARARSSRWRPTTAGRCCTRARWPRSSCRTRTRAGNPIWRHYEFLANGLYEGRAEVELVVRMISQVGNYDYLIDWVFTQHGAIRVDVGLTGIDIPKGVRSTTLHDPTAAADTAFGTLVAPQIVAPFHSHFFNFRLEVDVDGRNNSFVLGKLKTLNVQGSPRKSVWVLDEEVLAREKDARLDEPDVWKVVSGSRKNALGYPTGFVLESHGHANPLLKKADFRRAGFIEHALWVTAFDADERFAAGDTPNQNPDEPGLPRYVADNESIVNRDIVLWHTVSFHHVTAAEDYPVLPREHASFELKPHNFFDRNPALDLRRAPFEVP